MTSANVNVKIFRKTQILKTLNEPIKLDKNRWTEYLNTLKTIQKDINNFLTELVESEGSSGIICEGEDNDSEEDDEKIPKRKLSPKEATQRKRSKI